MNWLEHMGSLSDWAMVSLTGITAYFLIRTFRSQQSNLNYEREKYRLAIKPYFLARLIGEPGVTADSIKGNFEFQVEIKSKNGHPALNLTGKLLTDSKNWSSDIDNFGSCNWENPDAKLINWFKFSKRARRHFAIAKDGFFIQLTFTDALGNWYQQDFKLIADGNGMLNIIGYTAVEMRKEPPVAFSAQHSLQTVASQQHLLTDYGKITDWLMILVTAITAIFLYKTLLSQQHVQLDQHNQVKLLNEQDQRSIRPDLRISLLHTDTSKENITYTYKMESKANNALNVCFVFLRLPPEIRYPSLFQEKLFVTNIDYGNEYIFDIVVPTKLGVIDAGAGHQVGKMRVIDTVLTITPGAGANINFELCFMDENENRYYRSFHLMRDQITFSRIMKMRDSLFDFKNRYEFIQKQAPITAQNFATNMSSNFNLGM